MHSRLEGVSLRVFKILQLTRHPDEPEEPRNRGKQLHTVGLLAHVPGAFCCRPTPRTTLLHS